MYQISYGTETNNMILRYLRWVGLYPYADNPYTGKEGKLNGLLQGNFGYSYQYKKDVVNVVAAPMKNTIFINIFATILALAITIPLGIACARAQKQQIRPLHTGLYHHRLQLAELHYLYSVYLGLLRSARLVPGQRHEDTGQQLRGLQVVHRPHVLSGPPAHHHDVLLSGQHDALRPCLHDRCSVHGRIRTARAKGVKEKTVIYSHAWRNALIPIVTMIVGWFTSIFAGSLIFEDMFGLNGMGKLMISSLRTSDYDVTILMQLFYVVVALLGNLVIDIVYGLVDPRVRVNK